MLKPHYIFQTSLVVFTLSLGLAFAFWLGWIPGGSIYLETKIEKLYPQDKKILLPIILTLKNPSGQTRQLPPQDVCKTIRWFILDRTSAFVQSSPPEPLCLPATIQRSLKPWEEIKEKIIIPLDKKRYKKEQLYFLFLKFWDLEDQKSFIPIP